MKKRNKTVPAAYIFLIRDGQILLARRYNTGYQDGNYNVPSGHVELGELPSQAIIRETREEIGVILTPEDIELVHVSYRPVHDETGDRVDFFFRAILWEGDITNREPNKCDELKWFPINELPKKMTPHVKNAIECMQNGEPFCELGVDFLKAHKVYKL